MWAFQVTIKVVDEKATVKQVTVYFLSDPVTGQPTRQPYVVNLGGGSADMIMGVDKPSNVFVKVGPDVQQLFLEEGTNMTMKFSGDDFRNTLTFEGQGANTNNFIKAFTDQFNDQNQKVYGADRQKVMSGEIKYPDYLKIVDAFEDERCKYLDKNKKKQKLSNDFVAAMKADLTYASVKNCFQLGLQLKKPYTDENFPFMSKVNLQDEDAGRLSINYHDAVKQFYQFRYMKEKNITQITDKYFMLEMYELGSKELKGEGRDIFLSSTAYTVVHNKWDFLMDSIIPRFKKDVTNEKYRKAIVDRYDNYIAEKNKPFADGTEFVDGDYKKLEELLAQFKGKVVYVDVWASWCGPCKREMPHSLKLQKEFKDNEDIVFLFLDVNDQKPKWEKAVKQLQITGKHYYCSRQLAAEFMSRFGIRGIPRYMIVDKTGKIVNTNAARPSWPNVAEELKKYL